VLDVEVRDDVDPCLEQLVHVLPALLVPRAGDVRVRQLVDERNLRTAAEHRIDVHLLELGAPVLDAAARHDLEAGDLLGRLPPPVRLDERDDNVLPVLGTPAALVQHGERLPDAGSSSEVDAKRPSRHAL
jgi:hypothetical protein